ncbi:MAG: hypothetical protein OXE96_01240 [Gemmatimonadetes bacterium]|nr:hypothetical protein [Gemmatimonadota bacterium]
MTDRLEAATQALDETATGLIRKGCGVLFGVPLFLLCALFVVSFVVAVPWLGVPFLLVVGWIAYTKYQEKLGNLTSTIPPGANPTPPQPSLEVQRLERVRQLLRESIEAREEGDRADLEAALSRNEVALARLRAEREE